MKYVGANGVRYTITRVKGDPRDAVSRFRRDGTADVVIPGNSKACRAILYHEIGHSVSSNLSPGQNQEILFARMILGAPTQALLRIEAAAWRWAVKEWKRRHRTEVLPEWFADAIRSGYGSYVARYRVVPRGIRTFFGPSWHPILGFLEQAPTASLG